VERYRIILKRSAAREIESIDQKKTRQQIVRRIERLASDPRPPGCEKLSGTLSRYRIRQGPYRILYEIVDEELSVYVVKVAHRREVYRHVT
jgi:mRNA interferase RelE/StbE